MIVGHGMIASQMRDLVFDPRFYLVHASGVSNSRCVSPDDFSRDRQLLLESFRYGRRIIYFSSQACSSTGALSPYLRHKIEMETLIANDSSRHIVLRVPQVVGSGGNSLNLVNFFYNKILNGEKISCFQSSVRNLIDSKILLRVVQFAIETDCCGLLSFCSPYDYSPLEIIQGLEFLTGKDAMIEISTDLGEPTNFYTSAVFENLSNKLFVLDRRSYLLNVLQNAIS